MRFILRLYSLISRLASGFKNFLYNRAILKPRYAPLPVISVGNVSLGGTGKTPLAIEVMTWLAARGRRPALVSRGYRGRWERRGGVVSDGRRTTGTWRDSGDEPFMVAQALPNAGVFVGKNRLMSCERAHGLGFDVAVLDDGFQHRRLGRDLDVVVYSPSEGAALRESVAGLKRADVVLIEDREFAGGSTAGFPAGRSGPPVPYAVAARGFYPADGGNPVPVEDLRDRPILAFCGIARPARFLALLEAQGIRPVSFIAFPDHHPYPRASIERLLAARRANAAAAAVTTAKDAVKLADWFSLFTDLPLFILQIKLVIDPRFFDRLETALRGFSKA